MQRRQVPAFVEAAPAASESLSITRDGTAAYWRAAVPVPVDSESDRLAYRRPSRYCPSDRLLAPASAESAASTTPPSSSPPSATR